jgi:type IV secretory pathway VirB2 component (pilin)
MNHKRQASQNALWLATLSAIAAALTLFPPEALAQASGGISLPFITDFGCSVVQVLRGPVAILVFILVCIAGLIVGLISKMDWGKIIFACVIFGIIISFPQIIASSSYIANATGLSGCLR